MWQITTPRAIKRYYQRFINIANEIGEPVGKATISEDVVMVGKSLIGRDIGIFWRNSHRIPFLPMDVSERAAS